MCEIERICQRCGQKFIAIKFRRGGRIRRSCYACVPVPGNLNKKSRDAVKYEKVKGAFEQFFKDLKLKIQKSKFVKVNGRKHEICQVTDRFIVYKSKNYVESVSWQELFAKTQIGK